MNPSVNGVPRVTKFDLMYADALRRIMGGRVSFNLRTNKLIKQAHGVYFDVGHDVFPLLHLRDIKPAWSCVEAVWFMTGSNNPEFMERFGLRNWDMFKDPDGLVRSASGYRWRSAFGVDQLEAIKNKLRADMSSRQAMLMSWDPRNDLTNPGPNAPCIVALHFTIIDEALHMSVLQRSADMYFGFPHDILGFRIIQELLASELRIGPGRIGYLISNAHLYEDQWDAADLMLDNSEKNGGNADDAGFSLGLQGGDWARASHADEQLPADMLKRILEWYRPFPPIRGPRLVR